MVTNWQHKPLSCSSARQEQYVAAEVMVIPASAWLERQNVRLQRRWAGLETSSWEGNGEFMGPWPEQNSSIVYCIWYDMVILCCMIWGMGHDMMLYGCYTIKVSPMLRRASDPDEPISRSPAYHFTIWCTSFETGRFCSPNQPNLMQRPATPALPLLGPCDEKVSRQTTG